MADTRCANPEYQLEVDELTVEYLVYNTLKAHLDEWDPEHRTASPSPSPDETPARLAHAPTLLAILDTTVHLFHANHPGRPWAANTAFYLQLLEFALLFSHGRGGRPSSLAPAATAAARRAAHQNRTRRARCWAAHEQLSAPLHTADQAILALDRSGAAPREHAGGPEENEEEEELVEDARAIALVDLLPRFMALSAQIAGLTQADVSSVWLGLAREFMVQAAIEVGVGGLRASRGWSAEREALMACFGWGLPIAMSEFALVMGAEEAGVAATETEVHRMLRSIRDKGGSPTGSWDYQRRRAIEEVMDPNTGGWIEGNDEGERDVRRFLQVQCSHAWEGFEVQMRDFVKNLQAVWAQFNEEPVLLQIEQGRLEGLDDDEFAAFMERVGSDEHEARVERIELPAISKM